MDGSWFFSRPTTPVLDSWSGDHIADMCVASAGDAQRAVDAAAEALSAGLPVAQRAAILDRAADWLEARADQVAEAIRIEVGKPISAARAEAARAVTTLRFSAQESLRLPGETVQLDAVAAGAGTTAFTMPEPRGIVAAITPFNFPMNLSAHKIGPAIAAGCPVVYKPAERCPLSAAMLVRAFDEAGLPPGWLNLVTGPAAELVGVWQQDDRVAVINFTGSSSVGWMLKASSPRKMHILELGSNSAMVVMPDADLSKAARDAALSGYSNSGQVCISLQRLFVDSSIADLFLAGLTKLVGKVAVGDPRDEATVVAPLITVHDAERLVSWIEHAADGGARVLTGGRREKGTLQPTLIVGAASDAEIMCQEAFGPVIAARTFHTLDQAITMVNDSDFGLNTSIYTSNIASAMKFARQVQTGSVLVNLPPSFRTDHMPYGGVKNSGQGVEGVKYAVTELTRQKLVVLGP
jgi:acyl-CoA reductase-like NAD-dependent aldehyde dehydrogenase